MKRSFGGNVYYGYAAVLSQCFRLLFSKHVDFITDLDNYSDYTHYTHKMNDYMMECFADGTCQLTRENYQEAMEEMLLRMSEYDFESYLQED